jgi:hypothetical protein
MADEETRRQALILLEQLIIQADDLNYGSPPDEIPFVVKVYPVVPMS